jgi:hypothetical protein
MPGISHQHVGVPLLLLLTGIGFFIVGTPQRIARVQVGSVNDLDFGCGFPPVLHVSVRSLTLSVGPPSSRRTEVAALSVTHDERGRIELEALLQELVKFKAAQPDQSSIVLETDDDVVLDDLVRIIDVCIGVGLPSVSVSPRFEELRRLLEKDRLWKARNGAMN